MATREAVDIAKHFITKWEGFSAEAYKCSAGVWTIGYGHIKGVNPGDIVTKEQALDDLESDMADAIRCVDEYVDVEICDAQAAALISFVFNLGCGAFRSSTLLKLLNAGKFEEAALQFARWNKAGGKVVDGLSNRRAAERKLFEGVIL